ncbi:hypothetical protein GIX45_11405 [Erwinia sp. CPCC 100877]|nr:hypothetical protein [Erwinia sp. CPCC 100877]
MPAKKVPSHQRNAAKSPYSDFFPCKNKAAYYPIGNQQQFDIQKAARFRTKLVRTDTGIITCWAKEGSDRWITWQITPADAVAVQNPHYYHVAFFRRPQCQNND